MEKHKRARSIGFIVGAIVLLGGVLYGRNEGLTVSDWAAWVQALGSVLAILGAFAIANFQVRSERATRTEQQRHLMNLVTMAVRNLGISAHDVRADAIKQERLDPQYVLRYGAYIQQREAPVLNAPIWNIEDQEAALYVLNIQAVIGDNRNILQDLPERFADCLERTASYCDRYLEKYGTPADRARSAVVALKKVP